MHALCARTRPHGAAHVLCWFRCSVNNPWTQKQNDALRAYILIQHTLSLSLSLRSWCTATHFCKSRSLVVSKHFRNPESLDSSNMLTVSTFVAEALRQGSGRQKAPTANRAGWCINTLQSTVRQNKCWLLQVHILKSVISIVKRSEVEPCRRDNLSI